MAMCVNDIICHGAEPMYFLDYLATGKLEVEVARGVVESVARACQEVGCALLGEKTMWCTVYSNCIEWKLYKIIFGLESCKHVMGLSKIHECVMPLN